MTATRLHAILKNIRDCEAKYGREAGSVKLLAVSKQQTIEKIQEAFQAGQRAFGESYLQEALEKMALLSDLPIEWHFIGPLQSNKTRQIAEHFAWVHSVANERIAKRLNEARPVSLPPLNICLQVNISHEETKSGADPQAIFAQALACRHLPRLCLRGLMGIPAPTADLNIQRQAFRELHQLWQTLRNEGYALDTLSMGMSLDFEAAIAEGSTLVRIGTALFGGRS